MESTNNKVLMFIIDIIKALDIEIKKSTISHQDIIQMLGVCIASLKEVRMPEYAQVDDDSEDILTYIKDEFSIPHESAKSILTSVISVYEKLYELYQELNNKQNSSVVVKKAKPKVLYIIYDRLDTPYKHIANYGYYKALQAVFDVEVYIASYYHASLYKGLSDIPYDCLVSYVPINDANFYTAINKRIATGVDIIVSSVPLRRDLLKSFSGKVVKLIFDLQHLMFDNNNIKQLEDQYLFSQNYDSVITCSPIDVQKEARLTYIPYLMDIENHTYTQKGKLPKYLLFSGIFAWFRFQEGIKKLIKLLPQLSLSNYLLYIYCNRKLNSTHPNIYNTASSTGFDAALPAYSIQPLDYTSGIPSKSLEALAKGIPVLTTPLMKSLCFPNYRHVYSYEDTEILLSLLEKDIRCSNNIVAEIKEDFEHDRSIEKVSKMFMELL